MRNHVVNKVSIRLPASDYENARKLQQNAQNWSSHYLPDLLEKTFDEISINGDYFFIDKIEIDITKFPWQLSEEEWKQKLNEKISEFRMSKMPAEIILKQWIFYLFNGVFERNSVMSKISEIESYFLEGNLKFTAAEIQMLSTIFSADTAVKRLFFTHSENFLKFFIGHFFTLKKNIAVRLYGLIKNRLVLNQPGIIGFIKKLNNLVLQNRMDVKEELVDLVLTSPETFDIDEIFAKEKTLKEKPEMGEKDNEPDVFMNCENAGLVLLLPFIKPFLENLSLVKDDVFTGEAAKIKACNVLHFLATGRAAEEEQELLLPKILCGFDIQEFVAPAEIQEENVKSEANDLLKSVIEHWEVLKNTSVESLRETFLQRDGQLKIESTYFLQVSNSGVDVLLSKLPWGFRNYKLPWMKKPIITEWH